MPSGEDRVVMTSDERPPRTSSALPGDGPGAAGAAGAPTPRGRVAGAGRSVGRGGRAGIRWVGRGGAAVGRRFRSFADADGAADTGLARLTELHAVNVAGDAALTVSLAGTVFALPTDEARGRVALFLVLTMAPFVLLAPLIGPLLDRFRNGRRWALGTTLATRAFLAWVLATAVVEDSAWLFPAALGCLVASRTYAVARAAAVPRLLPRDISLVTANSRLTIAGLIGMAIGGGLAGGLSRIGPDWSLRLAFVVYVAATVLAIRLPARVDSTAGELDLDGRPAGEGPLAMPSAGPGRPAAAGAAARSALRALADHRRPAAERLPHPLPGLPDARAPAARVVGAGRAGDGRRGGRGGQRAGVGHRQPAPQPRPRAAGDRRGGGGRAGRAAHRGVLLAAHPGAARPRHRAVRAARQLSLDALIQRDVEDHVRARVFSWSETILQAFWVVGGAIGITLPLLPVLGFAIVTAVVVLACLVAWRSRRL